jgi:glucosamine 6-phosphate synthetase-like amidotransferase/phosphosugar isomerase protein
MAPCLSERRGEMRKDIERIRDSIVADLKQIENEAYEDTKAFEEIADLARTIDTENCEEIATKIFEIAYSRY